MEMNVIRWKHCTDDFKSQHCHLKCHGSKEHFYISTLIVHSFWYRLTSLGSVCDIISVMSQWVSEGHETDMKFEYESETSA
jgi:hypothetical protein